ncbi:MAG: Ser-Thr-rich GPI-anchored membrane family protein, partial [Ignavibacteriaceae bacterium]
AGLLINPGNGIDEGLNTAWILHSSSYMKTLSTGYGNVYDIEPGLEGYAADRGYKIDLMIHASPMYDPSSTEFQDYGPYGTSWLNDGIFWTNSNGVWGIDANKFCDFVSEKLAAGIAIFLTIDTDMDGQGDHWVPMIGYDRSTSKYAYYDTYSTTVKWADIYYCGSTPRKNNSISYVRTVEYIGPLEQKNPPSDLIALSGYNSSIPLAWSAPSGTQQIHSKVQKFTETYGEISRQDLNSQPQFNELSNSNFYVTYSQDLLGYNIYRRTASSGYQKIASNLQRLYYRDNVSNSTIYYYVVTAVYSNGESNYSVERSAQAQSQGNVCNSNPVSSTPTLDGVIGTNEWNSASKTIINYPGGSGNVTMYAMNDGSKLYLAVDDPRDVTLSNGDNFSLLIDSDHNKEWPAQGTGNDGMLRFTYNGSATASYCSFYGYWPDHLSSSSWITPSGTQQAISKSSGHMQYEISIDLNSNILKASPGNVIGMCCFVYDNGASKFDGLKPSQTEFLSPLIEGYLWSYGPFAYMDFTIAQSIPTLTITSPNGGENWIVGSTHNITWNTTNNVGNSVRLDYSTNNGTNWIGITVLTQNDGSYAWTIPNTPSSNCKVRINVQDNPTINDLSDNVFTISAQATPKITVTSPNGGENWRIGSTYSIVWTSTNVTNVKIEYSVNNGINWVTIVSSTPSNGSYNWTVPNTPISTLCKVRISDASNSSVNDISDNVFMISKPIIITTPNGGENWEAGSSHDIIWSSWNVSNVNISYTTGGSGWYTIVTSTPSDGKYTWTVPNHPSTNCRVRIMDASNSSIYDESDNVFTISSPPSITVVVPNGGETWQVGSSQTIYWNSYLVSNFKVEYSTNSGANWINIVSSTSSYGSYDWKIPNTPSTKCKIRISDPSNSSVNDQSDEVFTISSQPTPSITVTSPNGGENWQVGSSHNITWTSTSVVNVKIEYSTNYGSNWLSIVSSTASDGSYTWTIPNTPSTNCSVKISDSSNSSVSDESINVFTISTKTTPTISVSSPKGGENWQVGSSHNITWTSNDVSNVKIEYSTNNGTNWIGIVSSTSSDGSYSWTIPNTPSTNCKVKITDVSNSSVNNQSNNVFTISSPPSITVTSPNGGENWQVGSSHDITWTSTSVTNVKIEYSTNSGTNWINVISSTSSDGSYSWTIPNNPSANCKLKISDAANSSVNDQSNNVFTISTKPTPTITVTSPNGGENWQVGSSHNITWTSNDVSNVKIEYSTNNGTNWTGIVSSTSNDGLYSWTIPNTPSKNCKVKISDATNSSVNDQSNNVFNINSPPSITVTSPKGGENWRVGSSHDITWTSTSVANVKIEYSSNNGTNWTNVVSSTSSDGSFSWTIPNTPSTNCKIKISDTNESGIYHTSEKFSIETLSSKVTFAVDMSFVYPGISSNDIIAVRGSISPLTWEKNYRLFEKTAGSNIYENTIEFDGSSINSDLQYKFIIQRADSSVSWESGVGSGDYGNRVYNLKSGEYSLPIVYFDNIFLKVISPNGGETWEAGSSKEINWLSNEIDSVRIDYSIDNAINWINIVQSTQNDSSYSWSIPNNPSKNCKIQISNASNFNVRAQSDNLFEITGITTTTKRSAEFSSPSDFIDIPHSPSLALTEFTIEFWLKVQGVGDANAADGEQTILDKRGD